MKRILLILFAQFGFAAFSHANSNWIDAFDVMWEMQWHQSGYPLNARKWKLDTERKIHYSVTPDISSRNSEYISKALTDIGSEAKINFVKLDESDSKVQLQLVVRRYSEEELRRSTCVTSPTTADFVYTHAKVTMSEQYAWRCSLHELMHAMGLSGHPMGDTVLTYFGASRSELHEIDRFVLKHWNSDLITPGRNVFQVMQLLMEQWIAEKVPSAQQAQAKELQKQWFEKTFAQMDSFADAETGGDGKGEPPRILYRSGRLSADGLSRSRLVIQGILGFAHLQGYGTSKNPARAKVLLLRGAQSGAVGATIALANALASDKFDGLDMKSACDWLKSTPIATSKLTQAQQDGALQSKACS
jgi:hypothetical protein